MNRELGANFPDEFRHEARWNPDECVVEMHMNQIVYIVGFVVIVIFVLGFLGLR